MQRDISVLIADLYDRAKPEATNKNSVLRLIDLLAEVLTLDPTSGGAALDGAMTVRTPPFQIRGSIVSNSGFEKFSNGFLLADDWGVYNNGPEAATSTLVQGGASTGNFYQRVSWAVANTSTKGILRASGKQAVWLPSHSYSVRFVAKAGTGAIGFPMMLAWNVPPSTTTNVLNPNLTSAWQQYQFDITWGASTDTTLSPFISINGAAPAGSLDFDDVIIEDKAWNPLTVGMGQVR